DASGACVPQDPGAALCCDGVPNLDPLAFADVDPTVVTAFAEAVAPLHAGPIATQTPASPETIDPQRVAVVTGLVVDEAGAPLSCSAIEVVGMPDYGSSVVRPDGSFAIAVNGGDPV